MQRGLKALGLQDVVDHTQHVGGQVVLLEQVPKPQDGALVGQPARAVAQTCKTVGACSSFASVNVIPFHVKLKEFFVHAIFRFLFGSLKTKNSPELACLAVAALFLSLGLNGKAFAVTSLDDAFGLTGISPGMQIAEVTASLKKYNVPISAQVPGAAYLTFLMDGQTGNQVEVYFNFDDGRLSYVSFRVNGPNAPMQSKLWHDSLKKEFGRPTQRIVGGGGDSTYCFSRRIELSISAPVPYSTSASLILRASAVPSKLCANNKNVEDISVSLYALEASQPATFGAARPVDLATGLARRSGIEPSEKSSDPVIAAQQFRDEKQYDKAIALLQAAAAEGNASAMNNLAKFYSDGTGVPQDKNKALELYKAAADRGSNTAAYNVGYLYLHGGPGLQINTKLGVQWMQRAAAAHNDDSVAYLDDLERQKRVRYISENALEPAVSDCLQYRGNGYSESTSECVDYNSRGCVSVDRKRTVASDRSSVTNICSRSVSFTLLCQSESAVTLRPGDSRDVTSCELLRRNPR